jgi:hypothetical protein
MLYQYTKKKLTLNASSPLFFYISNFAHICTYAAHPWRADPTKRKPCKQLHSPRITQLAVIIYISKSVPVSQHSMSSFSLVFPLPQNK